MTRGSLVLSLLLLAACRPRPTPAPPPPAAEPPPAPPAPVALERAGGLRESSGLVLARVAGKDALFLADEDDGAIVEIDREAAQVRHTTPLGTRPRDLLVLPNGELAATLPEQHAVVRFARLVTGELREVARVGTPVDPQAMALSEDEAQLFVSTGASHRLAAFQTASFAKGKEWDLRREPRAVLVQAGKVFVTHASDSALSVVSDDVVRTELGNGGGCLTDGGCLPARIARHAHAIVRAGDTLLVPTAQVMPNPPQDFDSDPMPIAKPMPKQAQGEFRELPFQASGSITGYGLGSAIAGPPVLFDLATIDPKTGTRVKIDDGMIETTGTSCLVPRAAAAVGKRAVVACEGSARVEVFDAPAGKHALRVLAARIDVPAGPSALAADGDHVWVWSAFARELTRIDVGAHAKVHAANLGRALEVKKSRDRTPAESAPPPAAKVAVARQIARDEAWLLGRALFTTNIDPRISKDGRACASCHIGGQDDGLAWATPAGKRRTRVLAGQLEKGPYGWLGEHPTLESHVKVTFRQLGGKGLPDDELAALLGYVRSLPKAPAVPTAEERGRELFASAECSTCHDTTTSDRTVHDVGTGGKFMTPTLAGIGSRRQLMHDGRYASLDDLLAGAKRMGAGSSLSPDDRTALVRYLETL